MGVADVGDRPSQEMSYSTLLELEKSLDKRRAEARFNKLNLAADNPKGQYASKLDIEDPYTHLKEI
jgi:urease beta subunit